MFLRLSVVLLLGISAPPAQAGDVWAYMTIYKEYSEMIKKAFETKYPQHKLQIFQAGSEKIQAKVEAELASGKPQADILLTSDPFWSYGLEKRGLLTAGPTGKTVTTNYSSAMVLAVPKSLPPAERPSSFKDLVNPKFKNQIAMGSPLESGTTFSTVAYLREKYGLDYFKELRKNDVLSHGGNSSVIQHLDSGEKKVGIVLLENVLAAQQKGSKLDVVYPADGAVIIPSVQVILKDAKNVEGARDFASFVLSNEGQQILVKGFMYPANGKVKGPPNAKPLKEISKNSILWNEADMRRIEASHREIKKQFQQTVLE